MNTIIFYTISGNTEGFAKRFIDEGYKVQSFLEPINEPFVIFTPTYDFGKIPAPVVRLLDENYENLKGVVGFGDRTWGPSFARASDVIQYRYNVPIFAKIEKRGNDKEFESLRGKLNEYFSRRTHHS